MSNTKNIINNIMENNLVDAKAQIHLELVKKLGNLLESKIEEVAPSMIISEEDTEKTERKKDVTRKMAMNDTDDSKTSKTAKKKNIKDDVEHDVELDDEDKFNDDFENFVDQIHEIVAEIEQEIGEELTEDQIIEIGNEYLNILNEENDDEELIEAKDLPGKQEKLDVAEPKGKLTGADFKKLRASKGK